MPSVASLNSNESCLISIDTFRLRRKITKDFKSGDKILLRSIAFDAIAVAT